MILCYTMNYYNIIYIYIYIHIYLSLSLYIDICIYIYIHISLPRKRLERGERESWIEYGGGGMQRRSHVDHVPDSAPSLIGFSWRVGLEKYQSV